MVYNKTKRKRKLNIFLVKYYLVLNLVFCDVSIFDLLFDEGVLDKESDTIEEVDVAEEIDECSRIFRASSSIWRHDYTSKSRSSVSSLLFDSFILIVSVDFISLVLIVPRDIDEDDIELDVVG